MESAVGDPAHHDQADAGRADHEQATTDQMDNDQAGNGQTSNDQTERDQTSTRPANDGRAACSAVPPQDMAEAGQQAHLPTDARPKDSETPLPRETKTTTTTTTTTTIRWPDDMPWQERRRLVKQYLKHGDFRRLAADVAQFDKGPKDVDEPAAQAAATSAQGDEKPDGRSEDDETSNDRPEDSGDLPPRQMLATVLFPAGMSWEERRRHTEQYLQDCELRALTVRDAGFNLGLQTPGEQPAGAPITSSDRDDEKPDGRSQALAASPPRQMPAAMQLPADVPWEGRQRHTEQDEKDRELRALTARNTRFNKSVAQATSSDQNNEGEPAGVTSRTRKSGKRIQCEPTSAACRRNLDILLISAGKQGPTCSRPVDSADRVPGATIQTTSVAISLGTVMSGACPQRSRMKQDLPFCLLCLISPVLVLYLARSGLRQRCFIPTRQWF
ncbi:hypothetical protein VTK73DRAFT_4919 [Phialemonium thermophilum]|uniref:Clr5 domain-containing protein n=1 Tax=Phialemonium thermophilum TaxID=223376 RepID=A0ABR3WR92_9PEZI